MKSFLTLAAGAALVGIVSATVTMTAVQSLPAQVSSANPSPILRISDDGVISVPVNTPAFVLCQHAGSLPISIPAQSESRVIAYKYDEDFLERFIRFMAGETFAWGDNFYLSPYYRRQGHASAFSTFERGTWYYLFSDDSSLQLDCGSTGLRATRLPGSTSGGTSSSAQTSSNPSSVGSRAATSSSTASYAAVSSSVVQASSQAASLRSSASSRNAATSLPGGGGIFGNPNYTAASSARSYPAGCGDNVCSYGESTLSCPLDCVYSYVPWTVVGTECPTDLAVNPSMFVSRSGRFVGYTLKKTVSPSDPLAGYAPQDLFIRDRISGTHQYVPYVTWAALGTDGTVQYDTIQQQNNGSFQTVRRTMTIAEGSAAQGTAPALTSITDGRITTVDAILTTSTDGTKSLIRASGPSYVSGGPGDFEFRYIAIYNATTGNVETLNDVMSSYWAKPMYLNHSLAIRATMNGDGTVVVANHAAASGSPLFVILPQTHTVERLCRPSFN